MYGNNELKNYWNDDKKVLKAESEALEDKKKNSTNNKTYYTNDNNIKSTNQINLNLSNTEKKKEGINIPILILFFISLGLAIGITYFIIFKLSGIVEERNKEQIRIQKQEEQKYLLERYLQQEKNKNYQREKTITNQRNSIKLDNNIYSDNIYNIQLAINLHYGDNEFTKNLEPFFNNLTTIQLPKNDKIYEFEIKGMLSKYGNFTFIIYKRTNILEYDNQVIKELNRLKKIKFREQRKDVHFYLTVTNKYKLIR